MLRCDLHILVAIACILHMCKCVYVLRIRPLHTLAFQKHNFLHCGQPTFLTTMTCIAYVCIHYVKAVPNTCFQTFDFYVVAYLGSLLVLHVLYMSVNEMHIYITLSMLKQALMLNCFSKFDFYVVESKVLSAIMVHVYITEMCISYMYVNMVKAAPYTCFSNFLFITLWPT